MIRYEVRFQTPYNSFFPMTLNETDLQNLLTLIDFHDDYDEVKEVWGFDIEPLREKIVTELTH